MSIAEINALYSGYESALLAADYAGAIKYLMLLKGRLAASPNLTKETGGGSNAASQSITWNPTQIDSLISQCRALQAQTAATVGGPFVQIPITYQRPDSTSGDEY